MIKRSKEFTFGVPPRAGKQQGMVEAYLETFRRRPEPDHRGRYAVIWTRGGVEFGYRFSSKSRARGFVRWKLARARPGLSVYVTRFKVGEWICPPDHEAPGIRRIHYLGAAPQPESPFVQRQIEAMRPPGYDLPT